MKSKQVPIYTGYFSKIKSYIEDGLFPICIARGVPKFINEIVTYNPLFPPWELIDMYKKTGDINKYTEIYNNNVLSRLSKNRVYVDLISISSGEPVILLCWENPNSFCHRQLVAKWLNDVCKVTEYK